MTRIRCAGSATYSSEQSSTVPSHLCGFQTSESAPATPSTIQRISGSSSAEPAIAASTCTHIPYRRASGTICASGSTAVVPVVPTLTTTAAGRRPWATSASSSAASASGRMAYVTGSTAANRRLSRPNPASATALVIEECACSVV